MSLAEARAEARAQAREEISVTPVRDSNVRGMLVRFAFGFAVSALVGVVTLVFGDRVGGLFLAFPAILPASLTLIAEKDGDGEAQVDAAGAVIGGIALVAFGAVSWFLLPRVAPVWAELLALVAWTSLAVGLYLVVRWRARA